MNKEEFRGWQEVLFFTYQQTFKSKAVKILTVIFVLAALLVVPIMAAISSNNAKDKKDDSATGNSGAGLIEKMYIFDETGRFADEVLDYYAGLEEFSETEFIKATDLKKTKERIKNSKDEMLSILLIISEKETYHLNFYYNKDGEIGIMDLEDVTDVVVDGFKEVVIASLNLNEDQKLLVSNRIQTATTVLSTEKTKVKDHKIYFEEYQYTFSLILVMTFTMVLSFCGEAVANSIITEKSSKIIELLMTSIKPMAIITGKVLGMLGVVLSQGILLVGCLAASSFLANSLFPAGMETGKLYPKQMTSMMDSIEIDTHMLWAKVLLILVIFILGFLIFGLLAGIAGATVSKLSDLAEGMKLYSLSLVICAYVGIFSVQFGTSGIQTWLLHVFSLIPIFSPFTLTVYLLLGKEAIWVGVLAVVLMIICLYLLLRFAADVYDYLIYYNGDPIKLNKLLKLSKARKGDKKHAE